MMKSEFDTLIGEECKNDDYQQIELVYTYHPAISDKQSIADLYLKYGMTVITDMVPRATRISKIEAEIFNQRQKLNTLETELVRAKTTEEPTS